ncbi:S1-like domain-containing RNA-binding protein [Vallitalea sp.]|jgi:predicted RNA-binding protein (virulence factor B family)|uniref:S1-like domain-containing RNA-binding protein n=1 Tax=Vallitalea sp. TaxID=1882829 RepID=UPI0025CE15F1|nr:S1-like domain-containing RNA-binding protein [Vallitalea sp.]MCT4686623.1 S1-like domain-containing RNA-binding protein [Vallitalea sp.]
MIKLGKVQLLTVKRLSPIGIFLTSNENEKKEEEGFISDHYLDEKKDKEKEEVLLPKKQVPEGIKVGHQLEVFIYKDSKDRPIATTRKPKLVLGELAPLRVVQQTKIGAFMDWGLERDLFLPFREQTDKVHLNNEYLVSLYVDKSERLCATMDVYKHLSNESPYKKDDTVKGIVISVKDELGAFVAIDNKYNGLIPKNELFSNIKCGDHFEGRVTKVREDGKLNISLRQKAYIQMNDDSKKIMDKLNKNNGKLNLNDKSSPDKIKSELNMSKNAFKRAIGRLLKEGKIKFVGKGIEKIK